MFFCAPCKEDMSVCSSIVITARSMFDCCTFRLRVWRVLVGDAKAHVVYHEH